MGFQKRDIKRRSKKVGFLANLHLRGEERQFFMTDTCTQNKKATFRIFSRLADLVKSLQKDFNFILNFLDFSFFNLNS
jgi:hypothetical protein